MKIHFSLMFCITIVLLQPFGVFTIGNHKFDSISALVDKHYMSQENKSQQWITKLFEIAEANPDYQDLLIQTVYRESLIEYTYRKGESRLISKIDSLFQSDNLKLTSQNMILLLHSRYLINMSLGFYAEAFQDGITALEYAEQIGDNFLISKAQKRLEDICYYINDYNLAEYYYSLTESIFSIEQPEYYQIKINKAWIPFFNGDYESAIEMLSSLIEEVNLYGDPTLIAFTISNLGICYSGNGQYNEAYEQYIKALELINDIDNNNFKLSFYRNLAHYYANIANDYEPAYKYYTQAKSLAITDNNLEQLSFIAYELSDLFIKTEQVDSAYYYIEEYNDLITRLMHPKNDNIYKSYINMVMQSSENRIKISEQKVLLKNKQIAATIGIIIIITLLLIVTIQKRRNSKHYALLKEVENRELSERLQQEQEIQKLQSDKLEDKLREITSYSLLLSNKNEVLREILNITESFPVADKALKKQIKKVVNGNMQVEDDWNEFMMHFEKVHPRFHEKLKSIYPDLTSSELKLVIYIRLGLSAKQIAQMLNNTLDSIYVSQHRLRKKMRLSRDEKLDQIIQSL